VEIGLFVVNAGDIEHLSITGAKFKGGSNAGFLAGGNSGTVDSVHTDGTVTDGFTVGGIAGGAGYGGLIIRSSGAVKVRGTRALYVGGITYYNAGKIDQSRGMVSGPGVVKNIVAGLAAHTDTFSVITNSSGILKASSLWQAGGLVGSNTGSIATSYASGTVRSVNSTDGATDGGLVGENVGPITNCYATASVDAEGSESGGLAGGLVGHNYPNVKITTSFSTGPSITGSLGQSGGGLIGTDDATTDVTASYWDMDTSHITNPAQGALSPPNDPGITGLTDAQLKSGLPAGFDSAVWGQSPGINNGYPYLLSNPPQ